MRLAAQLRGGFYPAPLEAVAHAATFLRPPAREPFALLDPCVGEGAAIRQLGEWLGCRQEMIFAIELDDSRAERVHATLPDAHVLAPASFFGCRASRNSFSLIWLNPPFGDASGGHRVEDQFLRTVTEWLLQGGVMALVCPEDVAGDYSETRRHFATYYENCRIVPFPEKYRRFKEVVVFGQKCARPHVDQDGSLSWEEVQAAKGFIYHIPAGSGPRIFEKIQPTESELTDMLAHSPLRTQLTTPLGPTLPSPPLALGIGHVALLLAAGQLDGIVQPEGQSPYVVRGTSRKRQYVSDVTETENADGSTTTKTTLSEKIELIVRTVDLTGRLQTLQESTDTED